MNERRAETSDGDDSKRDTVLRYWAMAQVIPRHPAKPLTTAEVVQALHERGYKCTVRTVQRDLAKLSEIFNYAEEAVGHGLGWVYPATSRVLEIPGMQPHCALALVAASDYLKPLMPSATMELVRPYFDRAESVLKETVGARLSSWLRRIQVVTPGPQRKPPTVKPTVQDAVYQAVLKGNQLEVDYQAVGQDKERTLLLHPQGLALRDGVIFLVAAAWDYPDARHYALHRIRRAERLDLAARQLPDLDFSAYVEREFRYPVSEAMLKLRMRLPAMSDAAVHLEERPLSDDQTQKLEGDDCIISATVADTRELRWWLLSYGDQLEVLKPSKLRKELGDTANNMATMYANRG